MLSALLECWVKILPCVGVESQIVSSCVWLVDWEGWGFWLGWFGVEVGEKYGRSGGDSRVGWRQNPEGNIKQV